MIGKQIRRHKDIFLDTSHTKVKKYKGVFLMASHTIASANVNKLLRCLLKRHIVGFARLSFCKKSFHKTYKRETETVCYLLSESVEI